MDNFFEQGDSRQHDFRQPDIGEHDDTVHTEGDSGEGRAAHGGVENQATLRSLLLDTTGLVVGLMLPGTILKAQRPAGRSGLFDPSAWLHIRTDNRVVMVIRQDEFGQGPYTALAMLVANEIDAGSIEVWAEGASTEETPARKVARGALRPTGASASGSSCDELMLRVGATARAMLISAASKRWGVMPEEIEIHQGVLSHPASGCSGRFGEFAALAATLPVPARVALKR